MTKFENGNIPWNKGLTKETDKRVKRYGEKQRGKHVSEETKRKMSENHADVSGEKNPRWTENPTNHAIHLWIKNHKQKTGICTICNKKYKKTQWANISGEYKRDLDDWFELCYWCHRLYDDIKHIGYKPKEVLFICKKISFINFI